jgi:mycothiol synthase
VIRNGTPEDLPHIAALFGRANEAPYDLARVTKEKCFDAGPGGETQVRVFDDFAGVSVTCGKSLRILAVDPPHRGRGIGSALLRDAEARGARVVAAEGGNYFTPGVVTSDHATIGFFLRRGYTETADTQNLTALVLPENVPEGILRATAQTRDRVLAFIRNEFGVIWQFEANQAFRNDPPTLFYVEVDGNPAGFAAHEANNRGLGFFGPTGVAKRLRGRGLGARLLQASLSDLRRFGYDRAVIPWTNATEFYRKACGALPEHQFVTLARVIDSLA